MWLFNSKALNTGSEAGQNDFGAFPEPQRHIQTRGKKPRHVYFEGKTYILLVESDLEFLITLQTQHHAVKNHGSSQTDGHLNHTSDESTLVFSKLNGCLNWLRSPVILKESGNNSNVIWRCRKKPRLQQEDSWSRFHPHILTPLHSQRKIRVSPLRPVPGFCVFHSKLH